MIDNKAPPPLPTPLSIAIWQPVTEWDYEQQTWMAIDRRLYCIVSNHQTPPPTGDRAVFLITFPRPDGFFEHIYRPIDTGKTDVL